MSCSDHRIAYRNRAFLEGDAARPLRILAEYIEPLTRFQEHGVRDTVVFFGSARLRESDALGRYYREARELARRLTEWSRTLPASGRFVVCSGGGGGIMEAANRGAHDASGRSIGLNIGLPQEQRPNPYVTPELCLEFHYFFMRKLWFAHLARALVAFPGGLGTLDELLNTMVLAQTKKLEQQPAIVVYGSSYWKRIVDFEALVAEGMIDAEDLALVHFVDDVDEAFALLQRLLPVAAEAESPAFSSSKTSGSTLAP